MRTTKLGELSGLDKRLLYFRSFGLFEIVTVHFLRDPEILENVETYESDHRAFRDSRESSSEKSPSVFRISVWESLCLESLGAVWSVWVQGLSLPSESLP